MIRSLALPMLLGLAAAPAVAQPPPAIPMTLQPMAAPIPALRYQLLPELRDKTSGNAALLYYRAFSPEWQGHRRDPKFWDKLEPLRSKPLKELRREDFAGAAYTLNSQMLKEVDRGARRTYCDWELADRLREEGIALLLPDLQGMREFANLLRLRARQELLAGQYDKAARTLQTGFALARHVAEGPTLIHGLVGVAGAAIMLQTVEDWVQQPEAPNLYWALTDLPNPLIDLRNGFQGEQLLMDHLFPSYREMLYDPAAPPASAGVQRSLQKYARMLSFIEDGRDPSDRFNLQPLLVVLQVYPEAKRLLRKHGRSLKDVEAMPVLQAVFLYEVHQYDTVYDDLRKWVRLPYHQAVPHMRRVEERMRKERTRGTHSRLAAMLVPAVVNVTTAPARIARKLAALRCVEAVRLYAAAHDGQLPQNLEQAAEVPIPLDPWTGKPFLYRLDGGKATLTGSPLAGEAPDLRNSIRYELTIRPAKGDK